MTKPPPLTLHFYGKLHRRSSTLSQRQQKLAPASALLFGSSFTPNDQVIQAIAIYISPAELTLRPDSSPKDTLLMTKPPPLILNF